MTAAAIYTRVSTDDQAREGFSLPEQEARGRRVAKDEHWDVTVYSDPGRSGADRDRPDLARMMRDVEAGRLDVVWFAAQDRLARDVGFTADLFAAFIAAKVAVWQGQQQVDLSDDGQTRVDMDAVFAAWERRKIKARTRSGIAGYQHAGKHWGQAPYGMRRTADGKLEPDPTEAAIVKRIFALYLECGSYNGVVKVLTREGVRSRTGGQWGSSMIRGVIARSHPYVDATTVAAAAALAEQTARYAPRKSAGRLPARHIFVRGAMTCGHCGAAMLPRTERKRGELYETYQCRTAKTLGREFCPMPTFKRVELERTALDMFEQDAFSFEQTRAHVAAQLDGRIDAAQAQVEQAERKANEVRMSLAKVKRDYLTGDLSARLYEEHRAELEDDLVTAEAEVTQLRTHVTAMQGSRGDLDAEDETLRRLTALRAAVAGHITDANPDVAALRTAIASVFATFKIVPVYASGPKNFYLVPYLRPEALDAVLPGWPADTPVPRVEAELAGASVERVPLALSVGDENNQHGTVLWKYMTQNTFRLS